MGVSLSLLNFITGSVLPLESLFIVPLPMLAPAKYWVALCSGAFGSIYFQSKLKVTRR